MLDVDNKDPSSGLSSPPLSFITPHFLNSLISLLHLDGQLNQFVNCYN